MINKKSVHILNKKFKKEREEAEKLKEHKEKPKKHHFDYKEILNDDIREFGSSPIKTNVSNSPINQSKIKQHSRSRNNEVKKSKSFQPKSFGRKN